MKHFGLIGYPLGHSASAVYFTEKFSAEAIDAGAQEIAVGAVGAGDLIALLQQHLGQAGHAGAADADHVDTLAFIIANMRYVHDEHSLCGEFGPEAIYGYYTPETGV